MFRKTILTAALLALGASAATAAKLPLYDDFAAVEFDSGKWVQAESKRVIDGKGRLDLQRVSYSSAVDSGFTYDQLTHSATDNAPAKGLRVQVTVASLDHLDTCAANPVASASRARLMGAFFSARTGGPVAGDATNDVLASVFLRRASNSTDPAGTLRIMGAFIQCADSICANASVGRTVDLGTAVVGQKVNLQLEWDKANQQFLYTIDGGTPFAHSYAGILSPRTGTPGNPFNQVAIRNEVPNCSASRPKVGMEALFDNFGLLH